MRSIDPVPAHPGADDRTTKARIRDAGIQCIAHHGVTDTTARRIADLAGVSPGSVIHHFGSMEGLRAACDEHVAATIRHFKTDAMAAGPQIDLLTVLRDNNLGVLLGYLANVLTEDSPAVALLVDELVADAEEYFRQGVDAGILQPAGDMRRRVALLTMWNLGALVLHRHVARLLGVDLTDPQLTSSPEFAAYGQTVYEIYSGGLITDAFAANAIRSMEQLAAENRTEPVRETSRETHD